MKWGNVKNKIFSSFIVTVFICGFTFAPISHNFKAKTAEAIVCSNCSTILTDIKAAASLVQETASAIANKITAWATDALALKDLTLDGIAWELGNMAIEEMIKSTTEWINSGFEGSPAFVTNLNQHLIDIADKIAGQFIWESGLSFVCSPFKLNIQLALHQQYTRHRNGYKPQCTFTGAMSNIQNFMQGNFIAAGGWDAWYDITLRDTNNPYSALAEAEIGLSASLQNARGEEIQMLDWANGFLTIKECESVSGGGGSSGGSGGGGGESSGSGSGQAYYMNGPSGPNLAQGDEQEFSVLDKLEGTSNLAAVYGDGSPEDIERGSGGNPISNDTGGEDVAARDVFDTISTSPEERCTNTTPGKVIQEGLTNALNVPNDRLSFADEIDEMLGALLSQLMSQVMGGVGGLLGATEVEYGGGSSYFDRMQQQQYNNTRNNPRRDTFISTLDDAVAFEGEYQGLLLDLRTMLKGAQTYKVTEYGATSTCHTGTLTNQLTHDLTSTEEDILDTNGVITDLATLKSDYKAFTTHSTPRATLNTLYNKYFVPDTPTGISKVIGTYSTYLNSGYLHSDNDMYQLENVLIPNVRDAITAFKSDVDDACE